MSTFLIGGGWDTQAAPLLYGPFLAAAGAASPTVACVVLDEGDGDEQFGRWADVLSSSGPCEPVPVLLPAGGRMDLSALGDADALLVCGGLTPAYAAALHPVSADVRAWLEEGGRPYAGFSAGAAVAAVQAVVGGWRLGGRQVCPDDAGEDLEDVSVVEGLGLVPFAVDVHCAQWGTLPRLIAVVEATPGLTGIALDEDTMLRCDGEGVAGVTGLGTAWVVTRRAAGVQVRPIRDGEQIELNTVR